MRLHDSAPAVAAKRVLIVDDEKSLLVPLVHYFQRVGCVAVGAQEREEAEALLDHQEFDLIVVDLALSGYGLEGLDLIQTIRQRGRTTAVLVLSGLVTPEIEAESLRRGADAVLTKPQPLAEVVALANRLMRVTP
jgi:DNA-binding response OmpR family regulator